MRLTRTIYVVILAASSAAWAALENPTPAQAAPATVPSQPNSYLCIPEESTGFSNNNAQHSWHATRFKAEQKYIIRRVTKDTVTEIDGGTVHLNGAWVIWRFGDDKHYFLQCMKDFDETGMLFCEGIPEFHFSKKNGRFVLGTLYGYVI